MINLHYQGSFSLFKLVKIQVFRPSTFVYKIKTNVCVCVCVFYSKFLIFLIEHESQTNRKWLNEQIQDCIFRFHRI